MAKYKVLSVRQPYASLLVKGIKDVENRSRRTNYRGLVLIHASQKMHDIVTYMRGLGGVMFSGIPAYVLSESDLCDLQPEVNFSAIIGCVEIVDCVQNHPSEWAEKGQWHWVCKNAKAFVNPIRDVKGKLGIWDWEGEIEELEESVCL